MKDPAAVAFWALVGGAGGALATVAAWAVFSKMLDRQFDQAAAQMIQRGEAEMTRELRATLDREIPARVGTAIDQKLAEAGITRDTGRQISALLALAERTGILTP